MITPHWILFYLHGNSERLVAAAAPAADTVASAIGPWPVAFFQRSYCSPDDDITDLLGTISA